MSVSFKGLTVDYMQVGKMFVRGLLPSAPLPVSDVSVGNRRQQLNRNLTNLDKFGA
jgi:hypothetical protein